MHLLTYLRQRTCADIGRIYVEERRLVICGDAVGDSDAGTAASVRLADRRAGACQLPPSRRRRRHRVFAGVARGARPAEHLSARDLRPDARVLATRRAAEAVVPRDSHVPAAQELRLQPGRRTSSLSADRQRRLTSARLLFALYRKRPILLYFLIIRWLSVKGELISIFSVPVYKIRKKFDVSGYEFVKSTRRT